MWQRYLPKFNSSTCSAMLVGDKNASPAPLEAETGPDAKAPDAAEEQVDSQAPGRNGTHDAEYVSPRPLPPAAFPTALPPVPTATALPSSTPLVDNMSASTTAAPTVAAAATGLPPLVELGAAPPDGSAAGATPVNGSGTLNATVGADEPSAELVEATAECRCLVACDAPQGSGADAAAPPHAGLIDAGLRWGLCMDSAEPVQNSSHAACLASPSSPPAPADATPAATTPALPPPPPYVDIVVLTDAQYAVGVGAVVNAARRYTSVPVRVFVGFDGDPAMMEDYLACVGVAAANVTVRRSVPLFNAGYMPAAAKPGRERYAVASPSLLLSFFLVPPPLLPPSCSLQAPSNYARFTIHRTFPELRAAFYLDVDTLPVADLAEPLADFVALGAVLRPSGRLGKPVSYAFHADFAAAFEARYGRAFIGDEPSFNGGVWLADFGRFSELGVDTEALFWVKANAARVAKGEKAFWALATQVSRRLGGRVGQTMGGEGRGALL